MHREQFYVSISRGRDQCRVFTDDKELLRAHVTDSSARLAAIETVTKAPKRSLLNLARQIAHRVALTARRLHKTLSPVQSIESTAPQLSTTVEVLELADDRQALDRICATLTKYWRGKNEGRNG